MSLVFEEDIMLQESKHAGKVSFIKSKNFHQDTFLGLHACFQLVIACFAILSIFV